MTEEQNKLAERLEKAKAEERNYLLMYLGTEIDTIIAALREREPATEAVLAQFGNWVLEELRGENIGNDLDGGAAQDKAEELGILVRVHVTEPCGERCECAEYGDFPQMCLRRALKGKGASQEAHEQTPRPT